MKNRLIISLAVCLIVAAAGLILPYVVFDAPSIIGGAGRPTMQFYMRTSVGQVLMLMQMFAALFVICIIFTVVTKSLDAVKRYVLRWQIGAEK